MIFKRNKPINLKFVTSSQEVFDMAKPDRAIKFIPEWFQKLNSGCAVGDSITPTVKGCRGLIDLYTRGVIVPVWSDLNVNIGVVGSDVHSWQFSDLKSSAGVHTKEQFPNQIGFENFAHLKLICPWKIICDEEIYWSWQEPVWNNFNNNIYKVIPGLIEFKYQHSSNINLIFHRDKQHSYKHLITYKTPLAHIIPLSERKKIIINHELISDKEFEKLEITRLTFINAYLNLLKNKKGMVYDRN